VEDQKAFLVDGKWELDGVEDRQATRVVQAIRSRRYVNQREIGAALGITSAHHRHCGESFAALTTPSGPL
jgi:hypothetical protein